jgi:hypothetical protein
MKNFDPTEPLIDHFGPPGNYAIEQPSLSCLCEGTWWIDRTRLEDCAPVCTCYVGVPDWDTYLHDVSCDSVPCPFCPLETP